MQLTTGQAEALDKIMHWNRQGRFILRGAAGVGKSFLMGKVLEGFQGNATLLAPTGRASVRLTEATGQQATTIHSVIYNAFKSKGELKFSYKGDELGGIAIVDEASMVTERMASDLERCFDGVLYIGDHFQLPPVKATDWFGSQVPDVELTEVMRQALDSPILSLVTAIRQGKPVPTQCVSDELVIKQVATVEDLLAADQVICATNQTRTTLNNLLREKLDRSGPPQVGDRLINLRNAAKGEVYVCNGAQGTVVEVGQKDKLLLKLDSGEQISTKVSFEDLEWDDPKAKDTLIVDHAYCVTGHKSQGSQWDSVLVYDDSGYMRDAKERAKWTYTCLARAAKKLVWIRKT